MKLSLYSSILTLLAIISVGLAVRLYRIDQPLLEFFPPRQTQTAEITRNIYKNGWPDFWTPKVRYFTNGKPIPYVLEFPLYNGIVASLYHLFGPNIILGRLTSLTFFILSALVFYRLTVKTIPTISTILAILFFAFSPLHILISRSFQPEELALFLLLLAVYKKSWFIFSLAVLTKLPIALFAPVLIYQQLRNQNSTVIPGLIRDLYKLIAKISASLAPSLIWYSRAGRLNLEEHAARNFSLSNWFQPNLWLNPNWYFSLFQIEIVWVLTAIGFILLIFGIRQLNTEKFKLWKWWLICGAIYLAMFNYHAMTHEYYHIFLLPPLAVIMGIGFSTLLSRISIHSWKNMITIGIVIAFVILSLIKPAVEKIFRSPNNVINSEEITAYRYNLIKEF